MFQNTFRKTLRSAWDVTIKNPFLWILGIFASFGINTGIYEGSVQNIFTILQSNNFLKDVEKLYSANLTDTLLSSFSRPMFDPTENLVAFILIVGVILFLIYLTTISYIGLIQSVARIIKKRKADLTLAFHNAHNYFVPVLVLSLISRVLYILLFIITSTPIYYALVTGSATAIALTTLLFFLIFIPVGLGIAFITIFAVNFNILRNKDLTDSILSAWNLFRKNILISIEIGVALLLLKLVTMLITISIVGLIFVPIAIGIATLFAINQFVLFSIGIIVAVILTLLIFIAINSIFTTYYLSTWTELFVSLTEKRISSKLTRFVDSIVSFVHITQKQKTQVKDIAAKINVANRDLIKLVEDKIEETKPTINSIIEEIVSQYEGRKPEIEKVKREIRKIINEEKEQLIPTLKEVQKRVKRDTKKTYAKAKPKVVAKVTKAVAAIDKEYPQFKKLRAELKKKYQTELEKDLIKVLVGTVATTPKKPVKRKKITIKPPTKKTPTKKTTRKKK